MSLTLLRAAEGKKCLGVNRGFIYQVYHQKRAGGAMEDLYTEIEKSWGAKAHSPPDPAALHGFLEIANV